MIIFIKDFMKKSIEIGQEPGSSKTAFQNAFSGPRDQNSHLNKCCNEEMSDKANRFKHLLGAGITSDEFSELTAHRYSRSTNLAMAKETPSTLLATWRTI